MKYLVLGAGRMGSAIAFDLTHHVGPENVAIVDQDEGRASAVGRLLKIHAGGLDLKDAAKTAARLREADVAISAADYALNEQLTRLAIQERTHLCDLGGNDAIVARQLALDVQAKAAGVTIIPDCGLAPGLACLIASQAFAEVDRPERVAIRVGGLPVHPQPPLNYSLFFSVKGLINEYIEPAEVLRNGRRQRVEPLTEVEEIDFGPDYGALEAFHTSGGASTLPATWEGKLSQLDYKTIRYRGHAQILRAMFQLGLFSEKLVRVGDQEVSPRSVSEAVLSRALPHDEDDVVLVRVQAFGSGKRVTYQIIDRKDHKLGHSAMMRTTGYPTAVIARFIGEGKISARGVLPGETCVPVKELIAELKDRGIQIDRLVD